MYYSVHIGRKPGIYSSWSECQQQVSKFSGAIYKKFSSREEAEYFLQSGQIPGPPKRVVPVLPEVPKITNNTDILYIYTDGSCPGNGKDGCRGGIGVHFSDSKHEDISQPWNDHPTNQKMELMAIQKALGQVFPDQDKYTSIQLYTDSQYSIDCVTKFISHWLKNNWINSKHEPVKNKEIIQSIYELKIQFKNLSLNHINSHTGKQDQHSLGNDKADQLAYRAATQLSL